VLTEGLANILKAYESGGMVRQCLGVSELRNLLRSLFPETPQLRSTLSAIQ
jgi:hypothetical protein